MKERAEFQSGLLTGYNDVRKEVIGDCVLYHCDCAVILPQLQDFDLILTDPPYGINEAAGKNKGRGSTAGGEKWKGSRNTTGIAIAPTDFGVSDWDSSPPPAWVVSLILKKSTKQILFGGNYFDLPPTSCWLVWDKENGSNDFADGELAWTNLKKAVRIKKYRWSGMLQENMKNKEIRVHPTQKPVPIMEWCLSHVPEASTVCDPFMGSGTTGVACARQGKHFTGIEREAKYFDIACERIATAYRTRPRLFDSVKPSEPIKQGLL